MPPHHIETPARAIGHAIEIDARQREGGREIGDVIGQRRSREHREIDLASLERGAAAHQDIELLLFGDRPSAGLGRLGGARVEAVEIGRRSTGAALTHDDNVTAATDIGRLVPPIAFGQGIGAGARRHERRVAGPTREIDERFEAGRALGFQDGNLQPDLATQRLLAVLRNDQHEALGAVAARRLEGTALALQPGRGHGVSCRSQQQSCQNVPEQSRHEEVLPHLSL